MKTPANFAITCAITVNLAWLLLVPVSQATAADDAGIAAVKALFSRKCLSCHHGEDAKGKLDFTSRESLLTGGESGPALVASSPEKSPIWQRIEQNEMPPKHPLSADEKRLIQNWIATGALWTGAGLDPLLASSDHRAGFDWWSLQPFQIVPIPAANLTTPSRQPIDDFVAEKLAQRQLQMSPEASRQVLIRRMAFDLLGLPPEPEAITQFVQDPRPDALECLTDELLASPHYGERWARHWLDVVRFGESNGFERDLPRPNAWPYRDWVIQALNNDLPYDDFVRWQLAGDLIAPGDPEAIKSVGFLVAGAHDTVAPVVDRMRAMMRQDELEDIVGTVGQTFLGLTVHCARCHDHKFDPITTREYYQLASALSGIDHGEREFTPPAVTRQLHAWQALIEQQTKQLRDQESPLREQILAQRALGQKVPVVKARGPSPLAAWDFTRDLQDLVGPMHAQLVGSAKQTPEGLIVDGTSFAKTSPTSQDLLEKTLEVRVQLKTLLQSGGGAISLQSVDGNTFDAITYAELEGGRWMPGSNGFQRTLSYRGTAEDRADQEVVTMTQVHQADGTIVAYRNGQPYGNPIRKEAAVKYEGGKSQVLFGLRHGTDASGNRTLNGRIVAAKLYDKALTAEEVAVSADASNTFVTEAEIVAKLDPAQQTMRQERQQALRDLRQRHADLTKRGPSLVYTAIATQPPPMKIHQRGSVSSLGEEVAAAGLVAVQGLNPDFELRPDAIESHRRQKLANWITNPRNPLFARVMTNRVWHYHFGVGLVDSPNDLGFHAGLQSHPELLEWLAGEFASRDRSDPLEAGKPETVPQTSDPERFSLKRLHRQLISSAVYRQSSQSQAQAMKIDANNRLLWRMNPRRLEAEAVRDAMLAVAGELNTEIGGKGYTDVNSYFFKGTQFYDPIDPVGHANHRRTLYRMGARGGRSPFLDNFDCPDPSTTAPRRSTTVTPLQALSLLNHSFSLRMAEHFADRLSHQSPQPEQQVEEAFRLVYGRQPDQRERELSRQFIAQQGLAPFCRALWNSSEFLFID
jgi:mono/diheme cytochrome c family protein